MSAPIKRGGSPVRWDGRFPQWCKHCNKVADFTIYGTFFSVTTIQERGRKPRTIKEHLIIVVGVVCGHYQYIDVSQQLEEKAN